MQFSFHKTQRSIYGTAAPTPLSPEDVPVYTSATTLLLKYAHNFFYNNKFLDKPYYSAGIGAGMFINGDVYASAYTAELGINFSKYTLMFTHHQIGESRREFNSEYSSADESSGNEISFGIKF